MVHEMGLHVELDLFCFVFVFGYLAFQFGIFVKQLVNRYNWHVLPLFLTVVMVVLVGIPV